jgi:ketosteroid isomerase-like protein
VSVWRRAPGGPWKVEVDLGISHPGPALWDQPLQARTVPASSGAAGDLAAAEARFAADAAQRGARAAYAAHGAQDLRYYRSGHAPVASLDRALAQVAMNEERMAWSAERTETARSADVGYVRGRYAAAAAPQATLGWYLRVWRREAAGWRIVLDVVNPAPRS